MFLNFLCKLDIIAYLVNIICQSNIQKTDKKLISLRLRRGKTRRFQSYGRTILITLREVWSIYQPYCERGRRYWEIFVLGRYAYVCVWTRHIKRPCVMPYISQEVRSIVAFNWLQLLERNKFNVRVLMYIFGMSFDFGMSCRVSMMLIVCVETLGDIVWILRI